MYNRWLKMERKYWIAIICKCCMIVTSFLITICINRGLGVDGKGEYAYVTKMVEMLCIFFGLGLGQTYSTFKRILGDSLKNSFCFLALLHALIVVAIGIPVVVNIKSEYGAEIIILTAIATGNVIVSMIAVIEDSIKRNVIVTLVNMLYLMVLYMLYRYNDLTIDNALFLYGGGEIVAIIIIFYKYNISISFDFYKDKLKLKKIYKNGFVTMLVVLLISINYSIDTIMLKKISNTYHTGIYSVGAALSNMFLLIPDAFKEVLFGEATKKSFNKKIAYSSIYVSLLALVIIIIMFTFWGKDAIEIFYGNEYLPSYEITLVLFVGSAFMVFFKILHPVYIAYGKQIKVATYLAFSAFINIGINVLLIPIYNSIGAAIASAVSYTLCGMLFFVDYIRTREM